NGQEVTEGVTFSDVLPNGDWTYQAHTYLTLTPGKQDHISCMVQHASLKEPRIYNWEPSMNQTDRHYIIGGVCALLLGAVFLCVGLIHYKQKWNTFIKRILTSLLLLLSLSFYFSFRDPAIKVFSWTKMHTMTRLFL
uniref:Immunoglobulin C1-set domain-containing protein n=1 Tax=Oryzias sinensis TaxID=183150 RepID=A0A8C7WZ64_9TELE